MIKTLFKKLIIWAMNDGADKAGNPVAMVGSHSNGGRSLNLSITNAVGGKIVNVSYYDSTKNQHYEKCYIIPDNDDFSESVVHIIAIENLSR